MPSFEAVQATRTSADRNSLWLDLARGLLTLLTVGVLGTLLKLLADDYQAKRLREEQRAEFRRDKYRRLVQTTNKLRRIPLLVPADPSSGTLRKRLLDVLDVGAELRVIKHEIRASGGVRDSPFPNTEAVRKKLERMYAYADALADEFEQALSGHPAADSEDAAWAQLNELPMSKDLLASAGRDRPANAPTSWGQYLAIETEVLQLLTAATLGQRRPEGGAVVRGSSGSSEIVRSHPESGPGDHSGSGVTRTGKAASRSPGPEARQ